MKKLIILISMVFLLSAQQRVAVIDFESINVSEAEAKALSQNLTSEIIALDKYTVVERSAMKRIMDEQKFQHSGCVDTQCAVELGKILGAKYIIVGSVGKVGKTFSIDARMIEVETGESYQSANYKHKGEIDDLLIEGMKSVANQLCDLQYIKSCTIIKFNASFDCLSSNSFVKDSGAYQKIYIKIYELKENENHKKLIGETKERRFTKKINYSFNVDIKKNMKLLFEVYYSNSYFNGLSSNYIGDVIIENFNNGSYNITNKYSPNHPNKCPLNFEDEMKIMGQLMIEFF